MMFFTIFWPLLFFIIGLCFGSFGNVIIARLPNEESVVKPRSRCPKCKTQIKSYDNVPVLSYLLLKGKCRSCQNPISIRYPIVESISGLLFLALYLKLGLTVTLLEYLLFAWAGLVASVIDLDHRILPDVFTLSGIFLGLLGAALNPDRHLLDSIIGIVAGGGFLWAVAFIYEAIKHEEGMGGGDIKLIGWIGAVLGWRAVVFSILVSSITGSVVGGGYALLKKSGMKTAIPFGPFLYFAAMVFIFFGSHLIHGYLNLFFPFAEN
jgi:leader peptidase (prepilin peptidase)/N-methyltransferase